MVTINDVSNYSFWDNLYNQKLDKWNLNKPTPEFINWESSLKIEKKNINICIPGCGTSEDALYLASKGYNVYCIDFSEVATTTLRKKAKKEKVKINIINEDFFNLSFSYNFFFDFIIEYTFYCAINPSMRSKYVKLCHKILKSNGRIVGLLFPLKINKIGPPFKVSVDELENMFLEKFLLINKSFNIDSVDSRINNELFFELQKK